jgi:hypothetical protein
MSDGDSNKKNPLFVCLVGFLVGAYDPISSAFLSLSKSLFSPSPHINPCALQNDFIFLRLICLEQHPAAQSRGSGATDGAPEDGSDAGSPLKLQRSAHTEGKKHMISSLVMFTSVISLQLSDVVQLL